MVQYLFRMFDFVWTSEDTSWFGEFIKNIVFYAQQTLLIFMIWADVEAFCSL
jgi:hypothetical protein